MSSILKVSEIQDPTNGNSALTIGSNGLVTAGSNGIIIPGSVIQVKKSGTKVGANSITSSSYAEIATDYRVTITPRLSTSFMLIIFTYGAAVGGSTRMGVKTFVSTDNFSTNNAIETHSHDESFRNDTSSYMVARGNTTTIYDAYSTTDTLYFSQHFNRAAGSGNARVNDNTGQAFVTVMEIAT